MTLDTRDIIAILAIVASLTAALIASRNARRSTAVQLQQADLTRIRDLRTEVKDMTVEVQAARAEAQAARSEAAELRRENAENRAQMVEINEFANRLLRERMEMIRYAQMPGVDINDWLSRYGNDDHPYPIGGTIDA